MHDGCYGLFIGYYKIARVTTGTWVKIRPPHSPIEQFGTTLTKSLFKSHARDKECYERCANGE